MAPTCAFTSSVTSGSLLFCVVGWSSNTTTCTVADNVNGSWTAVGSPQTGSGDLANFRVQMFYLIGAGSGSTTVTATLSSFNWTLARAAASLGASPWTVFRKITLPLIMPGVVTGAIFAFATSFDEVIVVLFIGGVDQRTIPRQMWNGIRDQINPSILVVSTLLTLFAIALFVVIAWLRHRSTSAAKSR